MPGKKLEYLRSNPHVCLLIEQYHDAHQWRNVVVNAIFQELPDDGPNHQERLHAWSLLEHHLDWWEPGALKPQPQPVRASSPHVFFALDIVEVSGIEAREGEPVSIS